MSVTNEPPTLAATLAVAAILVILCVIVAVMVHRLVAAKTRHDELQYESFVSVGGTSTTTTTTTTKKAPKDAAVAPPIPSNAVLKTFKTKTYSDPHQIYDDYYASVYITLFDAYKDKLTAYEVNDLVHTTKLAEYGRRAVIADLGCGTGTHLRKLMRVRELRNAQLFGIDQSRDMLDAAQKRLTTYGKDETKPEKLPRLMQQSFETNPELFNDRQLTHATCYYFSIYYAENHLTVLQNVHTWLVSGGYFCVHLVDPAKFDPVIDAANPFMGISLQSYMPKRKTDSQVAFKRGLRYRSRFEHHPKTRRGTFTEEFIYPKLRKRRIHKHNLQMPSHRRIIEDARKIGFTLHHVTQLYTLGYEYQYVCYLRKI